MEFGHRDRADKDQQAAQENESADERDGQRDILDDAAGELNDVAHVDHGDVRVFADQVSLQMRAGAGVGGAFDRGYVFSRRAVERPRAKDDQEARTRVAPVHATGVGHARRDLPTLHIEGHRVAYVQPQLIVQQLFDRGFRLGVRWERRSPEFALRDLLEIFDVALVSRDVLAPHQPPTFIRLDVVVIGLVVTDPGEAGGNGRDELRFRAGVFGDELFDPAALG